jgi:hypothetical protein
MLQKAYLSCRMDHGLMKKEDLGHFGMDVEVDVKATREAHQVGLSPPPPRHFASHLYPSPDFIYPLLRSPPPLMHLCTAWIMRSVYLHDTDVFPLLDCAEAHADCEQQV